MRSSRTALAVLIFVSLILAAAPAALADRAESETTTVNDGTAIFVGPVACVGGLATFSASYHQVTHLTTLPNGTVHAKYNETGTFDLYRIEDGSLFASGRYAYGYATNLNANNENETETFMVQATGDDGLEINFFVTIHFTLSASGVETEFASIDCR